MITNLIAFAIFSVVVAGGYGLYRRLRRNLQEDLVQSRIDEGWELTFPETIRPLRDRLGVDVEGLSPVDTFDRLDERGVATERALEVVESTIDRVVEHHADFAAPEATLPALWVTLGLLHGGRLDDLRRALDCFDIADALAEAETWAFTDVATALERVDEEVDFDDGQPPDAGPGGPGVPWAAGMGGI